MCASFAHDTQIIQWQQIENHLHAMHIQAKNLTFVISHFYLPIKLSLICLNVFCSNFRMTEIVFAVIGFNQMKMPNCFFLALLSIFQLNRNVIRLNERSALSNGDKVTWMNCHVCRISFKLSRVFILRNSKTNLLCFQ